MERVSVALSEVCQQSGIYVLSADSGKWLYKGSARELRSRLMAHMQGKVSRTRSRRPLEIVYYEYTTDFSEARRREKWLKTGQGRAFLKKTLAARVAEWQTQGT